MLGIVFSARAASASDDVTGAAVFDPGRDSSGKSAATAQWVFYGIGIAAVAAGATLYYLGYRRTAAEPRLSLVPQLAPAQPAGAAFRVVF